ncbi:DUF1398 domain-containing protein [Flavobacterium microcysteis]
MFTEAQIKQAHSKVKSGADFPAYIQEIKSLGITYYEVYVADGHSEYHGASDYKITTTAKYENLSIADSCDIASFKAGLKAHQQGQTDYITFITMSAECGVEKWEVDTKNMSCTYYDKTGNEILVEQIPNN